MRQIKQLDPFVMDPQDCFMETVTVLKSDYRLLLAVARAAEPFQYEQTNEQWHEEICGLISALRRLNAQPKRRGARA
jgi:hypothetical protein